MRVVVFWWWWWWWSSIRRLRGSLFFNSLRSRSPVRVVVSWWCIFLIWGGGGGGGVYFCISLSLRLPLSLRSRDATISLRLYGAEIIWNRDSCAQTFATCRYGCKVAALSNSTRPSAKEFSRTSEGFPSALRARRPPNLTQLRAEFLTGSDGVGRTDERTARMYEAGHDDM